MARNKFRSDGDSSDIGWRLKQLRLRRGISQIRLAELSGLDSAYLSRIESASHGKPIPKPATINRILDALNVTPQERNAVFHVEASPSTRERILELTGVIAAQEEDSFLPTSLIDDRWYRWYFNRSMRAVFDFMPQDYARAIGEHTLLHLVDAESPLYARYRDEDRLKYLRWRAESFRLFFAEQEFDRWYVEIMARLRSQPWVEKVLSEPPLDLPPMMLRQESTVQHRKVGLLHFDGQMNRLMNDSRFHVVRWTPRDETTARRVEELRKLPEYAYSHFDVAQP